MSKAKGPKFTTVALDLGYGEGIRPELANRIEAALSKSIARASFSGRRCQLVVDRRGDVGSPQLYGKVRAGQGLLGGDRVSLLPMHGFEGVRIHLGYRKLADGAPEYRFSRKDSSSQGRFQHTFIARLSSDKKRVLEFSSVVCPGGVADCVVISKCRSATNRNGEDK